VLPALGEAAQDTGEFVVRNRDTIASGVAVAGCIGSVGTGCVALTALAVGVRSEKRFRDNGVNRQTVGIAVFDGLFSFGTLGLVKVPSQLASPIVAGRLSQLAIKGGLPGALGLFGFWARRTLDSRIDPADC